MLIFAISGFHLGYHLEYIKMFNDAKVASLKPLSHQGGVLVAFSRRSTKMQNAKVNAVRTPWTPWQRGGNSIERRGKS